MKFYIIADFDIKNPPIVGGIEKRIVALLKGLDEYPFKIDYEVISSKNINFNAIKSSDLVLTYSADNSLLKSFSDNKKNVLNTVCSGMANGEEPAHLFNDKYVTLRFLSNALKRAYNGKYDAAFKSYVFNHGFHKSEYNLEDSGRDRKNIIWMASLGWGIHKGIREFAALAADNQNENFVAYCGEYENCISKEIKNSLLSLQKNLDNFNVYLNLKDEDKKNEFKKAKLFCSFSYLIEAGNVGNIEAIINNIPVATLNIKNNGSIDEDLGEFNFKFGRDEKLSDYLKYFDYKKYKIHAQKFKVEKEIENIMNIYKI